MTKIWKILILVSVIIFSIAIGAGITYYFVNHSGDNKNKKYAKYLYVQRLESKYSTTREILATEVENYITDVAPTSAIDALVLVDACSKYNVDIRFVLAQAQIESHFGTKGTARKTNSVFNVGAFDGDSAETQKKNGFGFSHPNHSIEPYLILLTEDYLVDGKTESVLLEKFVNKSGKRYASNTNYEAMLKECIEKIDSLTTISYLQDEYNMYKLQLGY